MSTQSERPQPPQPDPNEALRARLEQLSPEQRRVVAEKIATLRQQLRNASPEVLVQLRERLQPSPPQEPPGAISTTLATVATPGVAAAEAERATGETSDVSALLGRYRELVSNDVHDRYRSPSEREELDKLPNQLSKAFGLSGEEGAELLEVEVEEAANAHLRNVYLDPTVICILIQDFPKEIYPLLQTLPAILPLAQACETPYRAWHKKVLEGHSNEEWKELLRVRLNLSNALKQTVEAEVGPMKPASRDLGGLELEHVMQAEPQDQEAIKAALAARNRARLARLRVENDNMIRWNSFFEKRLAEMGKAIKPKKDEYGTVRIIDKPTEAPPAAFDATPSAQPAPTDTSEQKMPEPVEDPIEDLPRVEARARELAAQTHNRGFGKLFGKFHPKVVPPERHAVHTHYGGNYDAMWFVQGRNLTVHDLGSDSSKDELGYGLNTLVIRTSNIGAPDGSHVWLVRDYDPNIYAWGQTGTRPAARPVKNWFGKTTVEIVEEPVEGEVVKGHKAFNGQRLGDRGWVRYDYASNVKNYLDPRGGDLHLIFVVPPDLAREIDAQVAQNVYFPDRFLKALYPGLLNPDKNEGVPREPAYQLRVLDLRGKPVRRVPLGAGPVIAVRVENRTVPFVRYSTEVIDNTLLDQAERRPYPKPLTY